MVREEPRPMSDETAQWQIEYLKLRHEKELEVLRKAEQTQRTRFVVCHDSLNQMARELEDAYKTIERLTKKLDRKRTRTRKA